MDLKKENKRLKSKISVLEDKIKALIGFECDGCGFDFCSNCERVACTSSECLDYLKVCGGCGKKEFCFECCEKKDVTGSCQNCDNPLCLTCVKESLCATCGKHLCCGCLHSCWACSSEFCFNCMKSRFVCAECGERPSKRAKTSAE